LSYDPAGSSEVTLSVVPIVSDFEPPDELLLDPPAQPERVSAAIATPAVAAAIRRPVREADVISVYLFLGWQGAARAQFNRGRFAVVGDHAYTDRAPTCVIPGFGARK
jgi:hypothetical protein